jgi:DNA ligase 1
MPWQERREELAAYFATFLKGEHLIPVETITVNNEQEARAAQMRWVAEGFEGAILRKYSTPYESGKRSGGLIKLKSFQDAEFEIVAVNEGRGKFVGKAVFSCKANNGKVFDCCAPGTMEDRATYFQVGDTLIGKQLTVKYFELSEDGTPLFPVGLAVRDYNG